MTESARESIYEAISAIRLIDPHTHINPHNPASSTLADILGYHYYTELAHSAGMPRAEIEEEGIGPRELVRRLVHGLPNIENTANYQWLISICQTFFDFDDVRIDETNWESLYDAAEARMSSAEWPAIVLDQSNVEAVFLTNDFDDDLDGFDTDTYIPCLRTDDLVFHLAKPETRQRLEVCSGIEMDGSLQSLRDSLQQRFQHFVSSGARACAISIPPSFEPAPVSDGRALTALDEVLRRGTSADESHRNALSRRVFWTLAELCDQYGLPFDLMIGVNRGVYPKGVYQGQDLYDSRVSLIQYRELFNTFPDVKFPISVLASVTNQELASYSWIFPNVITNGHWWYSNTPSFIARDAAARLEAVPRNKQIGYYSDAYKLEFVWPKFDMYRKILAGILADHFVDFCGWSEERAIELGRQVLRDNVDAIFAPPEDLEATTPINDTYVDETVKVDSLDGGLTNAGLASTTAALAAGAIGIVEVADAADEDRELTETIEIPAAGDAQVDSDIIAPEDEYDRVDEPVLPDLPTTVELNDTVRIEDADDAALGSQQSSDDFAFAETVELDPLPTDDEIQAVDAPDVELVDTATDAVLDVDDIDAEADPSPLYVGDIIGDDDDDDNGDVNVLDDVPAENDGEEIRMLRGETSFTPDEDSMQLTRDPATGEYTFPVDGGDEDTSASGDDDIVLEETIEIVPDDAPVADAYSFPAEQVVGVEEVQLEEVEEYDDVGDDESADLDETIDFDEDDKVE